ncbi:MAG TPA: CBS domain-containing protein [Bradyrhizobium sp.]|uniref:CBS domain-containing protein n=1 Tax=Bradyrhizobium sp. TaxID=376 RepID=UPI002D7F5770|nr:CBS domain-containing protein [Bradyrhizobium sp.]HET7885786.1 CBS domain-containing protein [Bradyrhizobium sp.]
MLATKVMRRSFETIKPATPLVEAARVLLQTNQRGLPVLDDDGDLIGILSEGDLLHRDELGVKSPAGNWLEEVLGIEEDTPARRRMRALSVAAIMTRHPACVDEHATVDDVVALMDRRKVAQVPVVRAEKVIGMISRFELLEALERKLRPFGERRSG